MSTAPRAGRGEYRWKAGGEAARPSGSIVLCSETLGREGTADSSPEKLLVEQFIAVYQLGLRNSIHELHSNIRDGQGGGRG